MMTTFSVLLRLSVVINAVLLHLVSLLDGINDELLHEVQVATAIFEEDFRFLLAKDILPRFAQVTIEDAISEARFFPFKLITALTDLHPKVFLREWFLLIWKLLEADFITQFNWLVRLSCLILVHFGAEEEVAARCSLVQLVLFLLCRHPAHLLVCHDIIALIKLTSVACVICQFILKCYSSGVIFLLILSLCVIVFLGVFSRH